MSANVNKCDFAELKYEQLMFDKYFVETCFSRITESYNSRERLNDMYFAVKLTCDKEGPTCEDAPVCPPPYEESTTTTTTEASTTTTTTEETSTTTTTTETSTTTTTTIP